MPSYRAKKRLGQNFLKSQSVIERILALVDPSTDSTVVEIGPGRGALTLPLAESGADIWAIEFDRDMIGYLTKLLRKFENTQIIQSDFLIWEPPENFAHQFILVGNLPYNITSPVIDWCVAHQSRLARAIFLVQREVAQRLAASPGSRSWSPLSIMIQLRFSVEHCFEVAPEHFRPPPDVTSSVVRLTPKVDRPEVGESFDKVVRAAFKQRRKLLVNNLVGPLLPTSELAREILGELSISEGARAEELTTEQFLALTELLQAHKLV